MAAGDPDRRPFLKRPVHSLLDRAEDCIGYNRAGRAGDVLFFCFTDGQLTSKQAF